MQQIGQTHMQRRPTTQDVSWLLDLWRNNQLDLDPPYQRKSVWTRKDRQFFLDTIFRNYPSPAIFLHKTLDENGKATYHVVDGKQRTQTIFSFVNDEIRIAKNFGDVRLDGRKWSEISSEPELRRAFWNYQITVEMIDFEDINLVNNVFDRLNRNATRLTPQELRHSQFSGWLVTEADREAVEHDWKQIGVVTPARSRRMADSQFISELMLVTIEQRMHGFDQSALDAAYGKYDDPADLPKEAEEILAEISATRKRMVTINAENEVVARAAKTLAHIYTLWSVLTLHENLPTDKDIAHKYSAFLDKVEALSKADDMLAITRENPEVYAHPFQYLSALRGANTDLTQRDERFASLLEALRQ